MIVGFLVSFIVAGVPAAVLLAMHKVQRRTQIPFGPFLAAGSVISGALRAARSCTPGRACGRAQ